MPYYGGVCQGDTNDAKDCKAAYDALVAVYGSSNVAGHGFNVSTGKRNPISTIADVNTYRAARVCNVLYWSGHGGYDTDDKTPALNVETSSKCFNSGIEAMNYWPESPQRLNVVVFASCYQLRGALYCSAWANSVMRRTDIRAICGYCAKAPSASDTDIAKRFFALCKEGSTGNSVMYSWRNANIANSEVDRYALLVYNDDNRCYYRLPGFSTKTYPDPIRSSTKIYVYYGSNSSTEVPHASNTSMIEAVGSVPYVLEIAETPVLDEKKIGSVSKTTMDSFLSPTYYTVRENSREAVASATAQKMNLDLARELLGESVLNNARVTSFDDAMAEVLPEGGFGASTIIGSGTRIVQKFNGIDLKGNCFAFSSDANGVYSVLSQWGNVSAARDVDHVDLIGNDIKYVQKKYRMDEANDANTLVGMKPIYIPKDGRYVLHYDLSQADGTHRYVDAKEIVE